MYSTNNKKAENLLSFQWISRAPSAAKKPKQMIGHCSCTWDLERLFGKTRKYTITSLSHGTYHLRYRYTAHEWYCRYNIHILQLQWKQWCTSISISISQRLQSCKTHLDSYYCTYSLYIPYTIPNILEYAYWSYWLSLIKQLTFHFPMHLFIKVNCPAAV